MFPSSPDPIMVELHRLENRIKDKERELEHANNEIKALKMTELMKDKAVVELSNELMKLDEKLRATEKQLEDKNVEIKKLSKEKKESMTAQFAAEAALRRVHAVQKDETSVSVESLVAPLESKIKMYKNEISLLKEDNKALESITKSKDMALIEAEKILCSALERALVVENAQNQNFELKRQIDILQEENKLLDRTNCQKVVEVEKLVQTVHELEESLLSNGETNNALLEYQRKISELNEEKKEVERELAKVKKTANRMDGNENVMPVKQLLDERKYLQGEINRLRDKLVVSERTAKADAQLKDKFRLRLKTLEECLKKQSGPKRRPLSDQPRPALNANRVTKDVGSNRIMKKVNTPKTVTNSRKNLVPSSKVSDDNCEKVDEIFSEQAEMSARNCKDECDDHEDMVSGFLYDRLQKEIIKLRKSQEEKDGVLIAKEDEIKMLLRKIDALTRMTKDAEIIKLKNIHENNSKKSSLTKRTVKQNAVSTKQLAASNKTIRRE
ncbi:microtubule-associated protein 70-1-like isoform X1 [Dioscorea cayenensis subsp. rotundata]|uniref:Microtubule-associated protein 70-1-like isoform X1 n=2 Tax=Dioscorea cayennensis subsp. rotundata TaxID=55577 RepID=A0AB40CIK0_DIOCR|nr:microtubule-associated protein 70-1-like isoform X1 [Dioscorea cayenensis subsp. rotundata]